MGDFNAPHTYWHYTYDTPKGKRLAEAMQVYGLQLTNDPTQPTRLGQVRTRDTSPNLTLTNDSEQNAAWVNTMGTLGSDHCIMHVSITTAKFCNSLGTAKIRLGQVQGGMDSKRRSRAHTSSSAVYTHIIIIHTHTYTIIIS